MLNPKSENEIMNEWDMSFNKPIVSICCMTYNHEQYLEDTICSFLNQQTDFQYEILIHDDASTDKTPEIISFFQKKYPNIIKPIIQKDNQYSKGVAPNFAYNFPRAKGKYIALCEGDDYWTDHNKLQAQFSIMNENPECTISYHSALELNMDTNEYKKICSNLNKSGFDITSNIVLGRGSYIPTASIMFTNNNIGRLHEYVRIAGIGDYFIQVVKTLEGRCYYIDKEMSVYRRNGVGSWTSKQDTLSHKIQYANNMVNGINELRKDYIANPYIKDIENIYMFYAIRYIKYNQGLPKKIMALKDLQRKSLSIRNKFFLYYLAKYLCWKVFRR